MLLKKCLAAVLAVCLLPVFLVFSAAAEDTHCYIDGENISCGINMAVVYTGIPTTGQSLWCHNVFVDADGKIIDISEGGTVSDAQIPEGGAVICATGTRVQWFKDNARIGKMVFFDRLTSRLFVFGSGSMFDPYFSKTVSVSESSEGYLIPSSEFSGIPMYTYDIFVNGNGIVVPARSEDEGAFSVSAGTVYDKNFLKMYAPVGAKCTVSEGVATFSFDQSMLTRALSITINDVKQQFLALCEKHEFFDRQSIQDIISAAEATVGSALNYRDTASLILSLNETVDNLDSRQGSELRGVLHTPVETDDASVLATLKKVKESGLNSISLRLTNGYGTFLPLPEGMLFSQDERFGGFDVLASYVKHCNELGLTLDVTVSVFFNDFAAAAQPSWITKTNSEENEGVSAKFFSPASEEFVSYFVSYIDFLVSRYDIDSLSLDYIRYPRFSEACDYGYDDATMERFANQYGYELSQVKGIATELFLSPLWKDWVEFKRGLVSNTVKSISDTVRTRQSDVYINAYVSPDIVDYYYMQDSRTWLENNWVDGITLALFDYDSTENDPIPPLAYGDGIISQKSEVYGGYSSDSMYFVAINSNANLTSGDICSLINETRACGAMGFVFSDLNALLAQNYITDLSVGLLASESVSPIGPSKEVAKALLAFSKGRITDSILINSGCTEEVAAEGLRIINEYLALLETEELTTENSNNTYLDIAAVFAASEAKDAVLEEPGLVRKLASLQKAPVEPPVVPEVSVPEVSEESLTSEDSSTVSESQSSADSSLPELEPEEEGKTGEILGYCFVALTLAAGIVAIVIGIRRRKK